MQQASIIERWFTAPEKQTARLRGSEPLMLRALRSHLYVAAHLAERLLL